MAYFAKSSHSGRELHFLPGLKTLKRHSFDGTNTSLSEDLFNWHFLCRNDTILPFLRDPMEVIIALEKLSMKYGGILIANTLGY